MDDRSSIDPHALALDLRPQTYGDAASDRIREPVVEPLWPGIRVIVAVDGSSVDLLADGAAVDGHGDIRASLLGQLRRSADGAILDGYLTKQIVNEDAVIYTGTADLPSTGKLITQSMVGTRRNRAEEAAKALEEATAARTFEEDDVVNLVLTDLLWLDGQWLLEIPLLERKRLLESLLPGDDLVRTGIYVRPPIATWIGSWRAQGFTAISVKEANSRYQPGTTSKEWARGSMPRR